MSGGESLKIYVQLYPPLKFADGGENMVLDIVSGSTVEDLLQTLDMTNTFGEYGRQGVFVMAENDVAINNYILKPGQKVKIFLRPAGG
jgi:sulfur carrier protein ThiS